MLPNWIRRWMHEEGGGGPYTHAVNGSTIPRRGLKTHWSEDFPLAYTAPCCYEHNQTLNNRFEGAQESVVDFLEGSKADHKCALWLLKTSLLFLHPAVKILNDVPFDLLDPPTPPLEMEPLDSSSNNLYDWMVSGDPLFCLLYTSPSPRDRTRSRMPSSA